MASTHLHDITRTRIPYTRSHYSMQYEPSRLARLPPSGYTPDRFSLSLSFIQAICVALVRVYVLVYGGRQAPISLPDLPRVLHDRSTASAFRPRTHGGRNMAAVRNNRLLFHTRHFPSSQPFLAQQRQVIFGTPSLAPRELALPREDPWRP